MHISESGDAGALSGNVMFCLPPGPLRSKIGVAKFRSTLPLTMIINLSLIHPSIHPSATTIPLYQEVIKFGLICHRGRSALSTVDLSNLIGRWCFITHSYPLIWRLVDFLLHYAHSTVEELNKKKNASSSWILA